MCLLILSMDGSGMFNKQADPTSSTVISIYKKAGATPVPSIASDSAIYTSHIVTNLLNAKTLDVS